MYKYTANISIHIREKVVEDHEIPVVCKNTLLSVVDRMMSKELVYEEITQRKSGSFNMGWMAGSSSKLGSPTSNHKLPMVLLCGKDGSGRTTVVVWLRKQAQDRQLQVINAKLGKKDIQVQFKMWQKIFQQLKKVLQIY